MKTCKQFFSRSLMLFTSEDVRKYTGIFHRYLGFILVSYPVGAIYAQTIYRACISVEDAIRWVNSSDASFVHAAVACADL